MTQEKREQIKVNLTKINDFLKHTNLDDKNQALIDVLENLEEIIPQTFDDTAFNRTKEILKSIVPKYRLFEGETPEKQAKLARKFIQTCMTHLLSTPNPTHRTQFDKLPENGIPAVIEDYADNPRIIEVSKSTYGFFKPTIGLQELLHAVVWSDAEEKAPNKVADILEDHPELLFEKGQITKEGIKTSKMYRFELLPDNTKLEDLEDNVIYISAIDNKISYALMTPSGIKIENRLTNIDAPTPLTLTDKLKRAILNDTTKEGYTPILYEQTYYDVSPFQLILFSGDMYLLEKIKPFITEKNRATAKKQRDELAGGGSDLVKLDVIKDGRRIKDMLELSYEELTQCVEKDANGRPRQEEIENGVMRDITWSLQENKNAIVLYNNAYYYVNLNHGTKTVENVEPVTLIPSDHQEQDILDSLFTHMEMNSSRRSNDQEHKLIGTSIKSASNPAGIQLERKGIRYRQGNDYYQDSKAESLIVRALRRYNRLSKKANALDNEQNATEEAREDAWSKVEVAWLDVGKAQATDTADKLLLYSKGYISYPYPVSEFKIKLGAAVQNLKREFKFNSFLKEYQPDVGVYSGSDLCIGFRFSLISSEDGGRGMAGHEDEEVRDVVEWYAMLNLAAFRQYGEMSRAAVDEFTKSLDLPILSHSVKY